MSNPTEVAIQLTAGVVGGAISQTISAPLERVKLLVQNQNEIVKSGRLEKPYRGVINCIVRTFQNEGALSFFRGNVAGITLAFSNQAVNFALKGAVQAALRPSRNDSHATLLGKNLLAGGTSGIMSLFIVYSMGYCRTRLANDVKVVGKGDERQFKGIVDVYRKTFQSDGIVGLYRGFLVSSAGIFVYRGCYFGFYDSLRPLVLSDKGTTSSNMMASFFLGYAVTISAGLAAYPFDTVRCRMMMRSCEPVKYKGSVDCAYQIVRNEGFLSLYKGVSVNLVRGILGAILLPTWDILKAYYSK